MVYKAFAGVLVVLAACDRHVPPPRQLPVEPGPRVAPRKPAEVAFGRPDDAGRWMRLREIRFEDGKTFGWRIRLPCLQPVEFVEVMRLPAPGDFTFDPEELRETTISDDKKTATTHDYAACIAGWIEHSWALAPEDPKGIWEITVTIPGYEPQVFRPRFVD